MREYDLILLYAISRVHNHYLNIIKYLSSRLRIGVYKGEAQKIIKTAETDQLFLDLCRSLGADILEPGRYGCRLLVVPQFPYQVDFLASLVGSTIVSDRAVGVQTFGYGTQVLEPLARVGIGRFYVYDRRVFERKLKTPEERAFVEKHFDVVEMGAPFAKYPVFEGFATDYLVALPTALSFVNSRSRAVFLRNVNRLLTEIPPDASVTLKLHNVSDGGRQIEIGSRAFTAGIRIHHTTGRFLDKVVVDGYLRLIEAIPCSARVRDALTRLYTGVQSARLEERTTFLPSITPYFNLGLELFLPGVLKGLITGRSSVVWYALVDRVPVYNCDDETEAARGEGVTDSYASFGVPPCHGRLKCDEAIFDKVSESVKNADLLELLQEELKSR